MRQIQAPKWLPALTVMCLLLGLFLSWELQLQAAIREATADHKTETLVSLITNLEAENAALESQLAAVRQETDTIIMNSSSSETQLTAQQHQLTQLQIRAGLTALEGPGVTVILDDNKNILIGDDPNRYVIHYENLLFIVNDLRNAGAEAISINGQRIVVSSEIRCVGNVILINTTRLAPPFVISAIGDPTALAEAVDYSSTYQQLLLSGFPVSCKATDIHSTEIQVPAYTGSFSTKALTPEPIDETEEAA
ncbi:MAG: DUF881 domain-containing protein [Peptococcaceae bacterium]|nr:DUF881 domain-containing protein [Peptococcaceae bacterium]